MTLTEKWKKGELPDGFYYFKMPDGAIEIASEYRLIRYNLTKDADKIEVLAPVPSYEELEDKQKSLKVLAEAYCKEREENQQLKDLLKECKEHVVNTLIELSCCYEKNDYYHKTETLLNKMDNAIGEKK